MAENIEILIEETVNNFEIEIKDFSILKLISEDANNAIVLGEDGGLFADNNNQKIISWGEIEGTLSNQTDLQDALDLKANASELGATAFSNDYNDLENTPTLISNHSELNLDDGTNPHGTTKSDVGLSNVDNTSDIDKPISDATQTALNLKLDKVTTLGVERVYTINTDGSEGTKPTSNFKDVLEFLNLASFPATGESGKIYIALDTNKIYRWSGSVYVVISDTLALGETASTAYRGDRGKIAYDHSQITGNPHGTTATDVDALKRDGSNANSDVNLGNNNLSAKGLKVNGTAGSGHLGLKHQSTNATAGGQETALFAGSDGELYYKNDGNTLAQIASRTWANSVFTTSSAVASQITTALVGYATQSFVNTGLATKQDKFFSHKLTTPTAYVTGTVSETEVYRLTIPANTLSASDAIKIPLMLIKKLGTNGTVQVRGKMSTSPTMPTGTTDLIFQTPVATAGNQTLGIIKTFFIDSGNIKGTQFTAPSYLDTGAQAGAIGEKAFDVTVTNYLYLSVINGSASDQTRLEAFQLTNS